MERPRKLYKYQPLNMYSLANLKNNTIWFSSICDFNDPFEIRYQCEDKAFSKEEYEQHLKLDKINYKMKDDDIPKVINAFHKQTEEYIKDIIDNKGIACFSESNDDILMWSHYSDKHKGFCLEFDTEYEPFEKIHKVKYSEEYPEIPLSIDQVGKRFINCIATKSKHWSYEKEWRIIHKEKYTKYIYENKCLTGIYFGANMDFVYKEIICLILRGQNRDVKFYEGSLDNNKYSVSFQEINYTTFIERQELGI